MSELEIQNIISNSEEIKKEAPMPLRRQSNIQNPFPIDALPESLRDAVLALLVKIQAPLELCIQSILGAVNLVVQGHANVMIPIIEQPRPISCFFLSIAESGERKSSCDNEALSQIREFESRLSVQYKGEFRDWKNKHDAWDRLRTKILNDNKRFCSVHLKDEEIKKLGDEPQKPLSPQITCSDITIEGLCKFLLESRAATGIFSAEGGQFIGGHGMKEENKLRCVSALSKFWDGDSVDRIRVDETIILNARRIAMHLMVQPQIARTFLSDRVLRAQGIFSRMLISAPQSTIGTRLQIPINPENQANLDKFHNKIADILKIDLPIKNGCVNELEPRIIKLEASAISEYITLYNSTELSIGKNGCFEDIKAFANKLSEHALRLATTISLFEDINATILSKNQVQNGFKIAEYYAREALKIVENGYVSEEILIAEKLLNWLENKWKEENISLPDLYKNSISAVRTAEKSRKIMKVLEEHGYVAKNDGPVIIKGESRQESWRIIKLEEKPNVNIQTSATFATFAQPHSNFKKLVTLTEEELEKFEERAAIMQYDGGIERTEAELKALNFKNR